MHHDDESKPVSDLLKPGTTLMVGSTTHGTLAFRPLTVAGLDGERVRILLDMNEEWARELDASQSLQVTLSDDRKNNWAWIIGEFSLSTDPSLIDELWSPFAEAYFDNGRASEGIAVMTIDVAQGRYWSAPSGRLGSLVSAVKAKFGDPEESGEHGDIRA